MFIHNLPYPERKALCRVLDINDAWRDLGGIYMMFDVPTLDHFRQAPCRDRSPTDEMLTKWGTKNHTVLELFILLSKMQHYQAMMILKHLVDEKYHVLIYEGEENFSSLLTNPDKQNLPTLPKPLVPVQDRAREVNGNANVNENNQVPPVNKNIHKDKVGEQLLIDLRENVPVTATPKKSDETLSEGLCPEISYQELEQATGNWDKRNLLGKGGFGTVYRGFWKNTEVAIKRLEMPKETKVNDAVESNKASRKQSLTELKYLNSCRHDNILPIYGYSIGGPNDCLVYQYMPKGSLEDCLLCRKSNVPLTWSQRHSIATGTARGLQYLHTINDKPLIHGDIKSANILLDPYLVPKIGDFGLAREGPLQQYTHVKVSRVHGTRPYLPDEFLRAKKFSTKVDTFSFGVVLFELATGLRAYDESRAQRYLRDHVNTLIIENIESLRDIKAGYDEGNYFVSLIKIGQICVSMKPKDRPEMVEVLQKLESNTSGTQRRVPNSASTAVPLNNTPMVVPGPSNYNKKTNVPNITPGISTEDSFEDNEESNMDGPEIRVDPPTCPEFSDIQDDGPLPLVSALGIKD